MVQVAILLGLLALQGCSHMLFYPMPNHVMKPDALGVEYEDIALRSADGTRLHGWWLHAQDAPRGRVIFFHGNGQNISTHILHVYWLTDHGYDVIAVDYRGYGASEGKPGIEGSMQDIRATLRYVNTAVQDDGLPLFVIGQSIGGSLAITALAQSDLKDTLAEVVLIGSFSDYHEITRHALSGFWLTWPLQWPLSFTVDNRYSPKKYIGQLAPLPVTIMHGEQDNVVPVEHARVLFEHAREPKRLHILTGDHNGIMESRANRRILLESLNGLRNRIDTQ